MDEMMTSKPVSKIYPQNFSANSGMPVAPHKSRRWLIIAVIVLAVLMLAAVGIMLWQKYHTGTGVTPEQTLEDLRVSSGPDTKAESDKAAALKKLDSQSQTPTVSHEQQLQILDTLSNSNQ